MISKTGITVLQALAELAKLAPGEHAGAASIARRIGARTNYLGKVLQQLAAAGWLVSQKGLGGGFRLAHPPERITLLDVLEPIDHPGRWRVCILGRAECSDEHPCPLHDRWARVRDPYLDFLRRTTLADVIGGAAERVATDRAAGAHEAMAAGPRAPLRSRPSHRIHSRKGG